MKAILYSALIFSLLTPAFGYAATISLVSEVRAAAVGDIFAVHLLLNPEGVSVNGIEGSVLLSRHLRLVRIEHGHSPVSLWLIRPHVQGNQKVEFAGIMPGGYLGNLSASWKGFKEGEILVLYIEAREAGEAEVTLGAGTTLAQNDGKGTEIAFTSRALRIQLLSSLSGRAVESTLPKVDTTTPSPFEVAITRDDALFEGKYAVIFSAQDEESGIARYEIAETRNPLIQKEGLIWRVIESPAVLEDQLLTSSIYIKAVDTAGNERIEHISPSFTPVGDFVAPLIALVGILILLAMMRRLHSI